ncbi:MAG: hypothetical protein JO247_16120, partial [Chloroflexi bacterium]|nr:hypothetical protein [Chloroflexota bacterium]
MNRLPLFLAPLLALLLAACGGAAPPPASAPSSAAASAKPAAPSASSAAVGTTWDDVVAKAKQEGEVDVWASSLDVRSNVNDAFEKAFP